MVFIACNWRNIRFFASMFFRFMINVSFKKSIGATIVNALWTFKTQTSWWIIKTVFLKKSYLILCNLIFQNGRRFSESLIIYHFILIAKTLFRIFLIHVNKQFFDYIWYFSKKYCSCLRNTTPNPFEYCKSALLTSIGRIIPLATIQTNPSRWKQCHQAFLKKTWSLIEMCDVNWDF